MLGRPNPGYWVVWMRVASFLPRRLLYGALMQLASVVAARRGLYPSEARYLTVEDMAQELFKKWGW